MAIVKMKRLRLLGLRADREQLLRPLQSLGCVEISEPAIDLSDPAWSALTKPEGGGLAKAREQSQQLKSALDTLARYAPSKDGLLTARPTLTEKQFFDDGVYAGGLSAAEQINDAERALAACQAEQAKLQTQKASLEPWLPLDVPLETEGDATVSVIFGAVPSKVDFAAVEAAVAQATDLAQLFPSGSDQDLRYFLLVCHASVQSDCSEAMRPFGYSRVTLRSWTGTAADNIRLLDNRIAAQERQMQEHKDRITALGGKRDLLRQCVDRAAQEIDREENKARLIDTDAAFLLEGWLPADKEAEFSSLLSGYTCAWETAEPAPEDYPTVPVQLRNGPLAKPLNMVTDMYALPAYGSVDPNPLMAPFFIVFYGMMMADMGYGIVMMLISWIVMKKTKPNGPTMRYMIPLLGLCGVSTFIWGAVTGSFFGDMIPKLVQLFNPDSTFALPSLFSPLDDALPVLVGSLCLGLAQIFTGMAVSMYKQIKRGETMAAVCNEGAWFAVFICAGLAVVTKQATVFVAAMIVILVLTQGYGKKGIGGKLMGIGGSLYNNITGYFSDILSYSRLMALMLAGAVIAQVFNTLGLITGNVITFFLISLLGNGLNFALNILGCFVHDMRLQCLEFFGRFYEDGGRPFSPLAIKTTYVDIK